MSERVDFGIIVPITDEGWQEMLSRAVQGRFYTELEVPRNWVVIEPMTYAYRVGGKWIRLNWKLISNDEDYDDLMLN